MPKLIIHRETKYHDPFSNNLHSFVCFNVYDPKHNETMGKKFPLRWLIYVPDSDDVTEAVYNVMQADAQMVTYTNYYLSEQHQPPYLEAHALIKMLDIMLKQIKQGRKVANIVLAARQSGQEYSSETYYRFLWLRVYDVAESTLWLFGTKVINEQCGLLQSYDWVPMLVECTALAMEACSDFIVSHSEAENYNEALKKDWERKLHGIIEYKKRIDDKLLQIRHPEIYAEMKVKEAAQTEQVSKGILDHAGETLSFLWSSFCGAASTEPSYSRLLGHRLKLETTSTEMTRDDITDIRKRTVQDTLPLPR